MKLKLAPIIWKGKGKAGFSPSFHINNPGWDLVKKGHGVDPDILVNEDLSALAIGVDPQLRKALKLLKN